MIMKCQDRWKRVIIESNYVLPSRIWRVYGGTKLQLSWVKYCRTKGHVLQSGNNGDESFSVHVACVHGQSFLTHAHIRICMCSKVKNCRESFEARTKACAFTVRGASCSLKIESLLGWRSCILLSQLSNSTHLPLVHHVS